MTAFVSSTDSVVCVRYETLAGSSTVSSSASSTESMTTMRRGASPRVPITSS